MDQAIRFKALDFTQESIGKLIKTSKKKLTWTFQVDQKLCVLSFKISRVSKNYSVDLNNQLLHKGNKSYDSCFEFKFKIEHALFVIKESAGEYTLLVECVPFKRLQEYGSGRKTMLIAPAPLLHLSDFNEYAPGEKVRLLALSPNVRRGPPRFGEDDDDEASRFFPSPAKRAQRVVSEHYFFPNKEQMEENIDDESTGDATAQVDGTTSTAHYQVQERSSGDAYVLSPPKRNPGLGKWLELSFECEEDQEPNHFDKELADSGLKESMDIVVYPNDFVKHDVGTERIIKVLYKM